MMMRILIALLIGLFSCQAPENEQTMDNQETTPQTPHTYLALGDSYTIGEAVAEEDRWPMQLVSRLNEAGIAISEPDIVAVTGWTTDELKAGIENAQLAESYDMVSLLIGVNNQYRGYPLDEYKVEFEELLNTAIQFAGGQKEKVFVVSIPDYAVTPFGQGKDPEKISSELELFNAANKSITTGYSIQYFDITPVSKTALGVDSLTASDGLHPSGAMYSLWVDIIYPGIKSKLEAE